MAEEVMETVKGSNKPKIEPNAGEIIYILLKDDTFDEALAGKVCDFNCISNLGNTDLINTFDKDGSKEVVLKEHYFGVSSHCSFANFVTTFRKHFSIMFNSKEGDREGICVSIIQHLKDGIMEYIEKY